jgi:hypothetical protein
MTCTGGGGLSCPCRTLHCSMPKSTWQNYPCGRGSRGLPDSKEKREREGHGEKSVVITFRQRHLWTKIVHHPDTQGGH